LTVFKIFFYCLAYEYYYTAFNWLNKIEFTALSKTNNIFNNEIYPSDYKNYFLQLAEILIRTDKYKEYIDNCLTSLGFEGEKHKCFHNIIISEICFKRFNRNDEEIYISRFLLSNLLRNFKEELNIKRNQLYRNQFIYNPHKPILMSEIADFLFCPVSYAINVSFKMPCDFSWENDEWSGKKVNLLERYTDYRANKDFSKVFYNSNIKIDEELQKGFAEIFSSKLIYNSIDNSNSKYFSNNNDTIRGKPDYIFENRDYEKFVVIEKFTKSPRNMKLYPNDMIKILTCLYEFENLNLSFGYMIYWYWNYIKEVNENGKKINTIKIISYKIYRIEKSLDNQLFYDNTLKQLTEFNETKHLKVDGKELSELPIKCLHCSFCNYCNHKTGKYDLINIPYDISSLKVTEIKDVEIANNEREYIENISKS